MIWHKFKPQLFEICFEILSGVLSWSGTLSGLLFRYLKWFILVFFWRPWCSNQCDVIQLVGWALESKLSFIEGRSCKEASWLLPCPIPVHALTSSKFQILHGSQSIETFSFSPCVKVWSWRNGSFLKYIKQFQINSKWRRICSAKKPHKNWVDMQAYSYRIKIMYPYYTPQSKSQQNDQLHTVIQLVLGKI